MMQQEMLESIEPF